MKTVLARPGDLYIGRIEGEESVVIPDASAGWFVPRGIRHWEREVNLVARDHLTEAVRAELKATMPEEQIPPAKMPLAFHAASSSPFVAISSRLSPELIRLGVRVHTIGADAGSSSFFYFAEGGKGEPVRIQGEMLTLLDPSLKGDESTAILDQHLDQLIDRTLNHFTNRELSEVAVELAAALPRLNNDGTGLEDVDLEAFEKNAQEMMASGKGYEKPARQLAEALLANLEAPDAEIALFGTARREPQMAMLINVDGKAVALARRPRWIVRGEPQKPAVSVKPSIPPAEATPLVPMATPKMAEPTPLMPPVSSRQKAAEPIKAPVAAQPASAAKEGGLKATAPGTPAAAAAAAKALEEAKRRAEEDVAKKRAEEAAAKKKADDEAAAAAKKKADEAAAAATAAAKKAEEDAAAAAKKKADDEAAAAAAAKKAEEDAAAAAKKIVVAKDAAVEKAAPAEPEPAKKKPASEPPPAPVAKSGSGPMAAIIVVIVIAAAIAFYFLKMAK